MKRVAEAALVLLSLGVAGTGWAQTISRGVVACGGNAASGPSYTIVGTIGQPVVGRTMGPGEPEPYLCSGWWCGEFGTIVGVAPSVAEAPRVTRMAPPAPNPAAGPVRFVYELARDSRVEITVYAVTGARVRSLVREERAAGRHEVWWDGRANSGEPVGCGVYFAVLRAAGSDPVRRRIVLVR